MAYTDNWNNLPAELVISITQRLCLLVDLVRFTAICKSWRNTVLESEVDPTREKVWLLLAEEVAPGVLYSDCEYDSNKDYGGDTEEEEVEVEEEEVEVEEEEGEEEEDDNHEEDINGGEYDYLYLAQEAKYNHLNNSVGNTRGLYSFSTQKTYTLELPEAAGRLILGLNNGWLLTLGRDLQIKLLHPLSRHEISLPPMLTYSIQYEYREDCPPEESSDRFVRKAAISSNILKNNTTVNNTPPIVMTIYGECGYLGFTKLGDKVWTDVNVSSRSFEDIIYHNGNFYAVDPHGDVYVCGIDDDKEKGPRGRKIASIEANDWDQKYLVESSTGSDLLLLVRCRKIKYFDRSLKWDKYRTTDFSVWRLNLKYSDSLEDISCTSTTKVNDLGNETIFVGRNTSLSMSSSQTIKPNCIYFTDDNWVIYLHKGGGHDMGIFSMEHRTIEPHFQGKSIHPISPPIWYFCIKSTESIHSLFT